MKEVQEDEYESDHVSFAWNGTCFHTSIAPLKLRDGNTYTFTYTYIHTEREREREGHIIYDSNEKTKLFTKNSLVSS